MSIKLEPASDVSLMTTELNALANNAGAVSVEYDNSLTANLYLWGIFELYIPSFSSAPTAGALVKLYIVPAVDGTNYTDYTSGASGYAPPPTYAGSFVLQAKTTAHRLSLQGIAPGGLITLPPTRFRVFLLNNSGRAFPANSSTLKMVPYRYQ